MFEWWGDGILHCTPELVIYWGNHSSLLELTCIYWPWSFLESLHVNYTPNCFALQKTTCDGKKVDMLILIHISAHFNSEMQLQLLFSVRNIFRIYPQYNIKQTFFIGENKVKKCQKQEASLTQWIHQWWNVCLTYLYQKRFLTKHIHHHPKTSDCQEPENYILIRNKLMSELILISSIISITMFMISVFATKWHSHKSFTLFNPGCM